LGSCANKPRREFVLAVLILSVLMAKVVGYRKQVTSVWNGPAINLAPSLSDCLHVPLNNFILLAVEKEVT
jgi:hypothetical protein